MAGIFYYLAAYTAAKAAGFSPKDSQEMARAACYADSYAPEKEPADSQAGLSPGMLGAFSYLPEEHKGIRAMVKTEVLEDADPKLWHALFMACGTSGELLGYAVKWARDCCRTDVRYTPLWQAAGIAVHAVGSAFLHQGFSGVDNKDVNAAEGIRTARTASLGEPRELRELLRQCVFHDAETLETLFKWEAYVPPQAPDSFVGCGQLGNLPASPGRIYSYQSPWRKAPTVFCFNPLRYADAYLAMKEAFCCIHGDHKNFVCPDPLSRDDARIELACFFAGVPSERELWNLWRNNFGWSREYPEYYTAPSYDTDRSYINTFGIQALAFRDYIRAVCPELQLEGLPAEAAP